MKKLYNNKGKVHPSSPPPPPQSVSDHHLLSLLPATILTLTAALSLEDKQVLAYLISCSNSTNFTTTTVGEHKTTSSDDDYHEPTFGCNCFSCYMSFWVRWDASPNRETIHDIIEAYEEGLFKKKKKSLKKKKGKQLMFNEFQESSSCNLDKKSSDDSKGLESMEMNSNDDEKSTVRKITSFLGEKIWAIWSS